MTIERPEMPKDRLREIYLKDIFFEMVSRGSKTLEMRSGYNSFSNIKNGDKILFKSGKGRSVQVEILDVRNYQNLDAVLQTEDMSKLAPGVSEEQVKNISQGIFPEDDVKKHGLIVFEFKVI